MHLLRALVLLGSFFFVHAEEQQPFFSELSTSDHWPSEGTGHLSMWSRQTKEDFLKDLRNNNGQDWSIVIGNEGGDLDSLVSALAYAYHLTHLSPPQKAIALLQTESDALDLRPENQLALHYARMSSGHRDLLTLDDLPIQPWDMYHRIQGLHLVDHNVPLTKWGNATILSIIDHHEDRGNAPDAYPRILNTTASCSSLVAKHLLDYYEARSTPSSSVDLLHGKKLPFELVELLMRTIAIDSGGLSKGSSFDVDFDSARRLHALSTWRNRKLREVMKSIGNDLQASKDGLDSLTVRDLLRRDWKGDSIPTLSKKYNHIDLGLASVPVSLYDLIQRTPEQTTPELFAVERAWTSEIGADVSIILTAFHNGFERASGKQRQIALIVAHGLSGRLTEKYADSLFLTLKNAIETADVFQEEDSSGNLIGGNTLEKWTRPDGKELLPRRAVWEHRSKVGRKAIRPIVEKAVREWTGKRFQVRLGEGGGGPVVRVEEGAL